MLTKKVFVLSFVMAFLSSIRLPFLPELELLLLVGYCFKERAVTYKAFLLLTIILCTHHYAIPDFVYRMDAGSYPSIYTRAYGGVKLLDVLVLFLFAVSIPRINKYFILFFKIRSLPSILLVLSLIGFVFLSSQTFAKDNFLFIIRSLILLFTVFVNLVNWGNEQFVNISKIAIFSWILKMFFSIVFSHPNPLYRTILGYDGIIYFAGDEYVFIPIYLMIYIAVRGRSFNLHRVVQCSICVFLLAMIAQRKGAIMVLFPVLLLVYVYKYRKKNMALMIKFYYVFSSIIIFFFLLFVDKLFTDPLLLLAFEEYHVLTQSSIDSILHVFNTNFLSGVFGISPFGKYEIINLPSSADHLMSFGSEVGEKYRYMLWNFPFGRCVLNAGILGLFFQIVYTFNAMRLAPPFFFLVISCFGVCVYENITPVAALPLGITLAYLYSSQQTVNFYNSNR